MDGDPSQLVLQTDRLLLRTRRVADAAVQHELWTERDPRVPPHRRIDVGGHPTVEELEDRIRAIAHLPTIGLLAVTLRSTGEVIGYCGLIENVDGRPDEPQLAYELLKRFWGRGYATEASQAVIAWARESGHRRLGASIREWNTASRRVAAKLGFVESGRVEPDAAHGDSLYTTLQL